MRSVPRAAGGLYAAKVETRGTNVAARGVSMVGGDCLRIKK